MRKVPTVLDGPPLFRAASFLLYHGLAIPVLWIVGWLVYGMRVKGRRRFRGHRRGMIAANHCQYLEPGLEAVALWPRRILFSAEENNVVRRDVGWLTRLLRTIGIPDDNPLSVGGLIKTGLEKDWFVNFYPEGTISWRAQEPGPFMVGVFFFAYVNDVPVFPVAEILKERPLRRLLPWWPPRTAFVVCDPVHPRDFRIEGASRRERIHRMADAVRERILDAIEAEGGCRTLPERREPDDPDKAVLRD